MQSFCVISFVRLLYFTSSSFWYYGILHLWSTSKDRFRYFALIVIYAVTKLIRLYLYFPNKRRIIAWCDRFLFGQFAGRCVNIKQFQDVWILINNKHQSTFIINLEMSWHCSWRWLWLENNRTYFWNIWNLSYYPIFYNSLTFTVCMYQTCIFSRFPSSKILYTSIAPLAMRLSRLLQ